MAAQAGASQPAESAQPPNPNMPPKQIDLFTAGIVHTDTYPEIDPLTKSNCTGKSVLITGASKGLGRAIAAGYAQAGASQIALAARTDVSDTAAVVLKAALSAGRPEPTVLSLEMDVCDSDSVKAAAAQLESAWGRLDILICGAGYLAPFSDLLDADDEEYMRAWDVNYWGTYRCCKAFLPLMLRTEGGDKTIITLTSVGALFVGSGGGAYHVSKFALMRLVEFIQDEYKSQGALVYSVHPGGTPTDLSSNLPEKFKFRMTDTPELAAHSIPFLTSEKRDWLGGRWMSCKWDIPQLLKMKDEIVEKDLLKLKCTGLQ